MIARAAETLSNGEVLELVLGIRGKGIERLSVGGSTVVLLSVVFGLILVPACVSGYARSVHFSPDSSIVAYVWGTHAALPIGPEPYRIAQTAYIRWCSVNQPENQRSIKIDSVGLRHSGYFLAGHFVFMKFSPDSRHLAVVSRGFLNCIDLQSAKRHQLSSDEEIVTSFAWLRNEEIAYAAQSGLRGTTSNVGDRIFWRQRIDDSLDKRTVVYRESRIRSVIRSRERAGIAPLEYWSPQGRYVIFVTPRHRGILHVLDTKAGKVLSFGHECARPEGVAWKLDDSAAICLINFRQRIGEPPQLEALLLDPPTGHAFDLTKTFAESFGAEHTEIVPHWTTDGEYFVVNPGGYLVRPRPWEVISVAKSFAQQLGVRSYERPISIYPLGVPGWVQGSAEGRVYAFNYVENKLLELGDPSPAGVAVSPDGTKIATLTRNGKVIISKVNLRSSQTTLEQEKPGGAGKPES